MAAVIYTLCALTALACAVLLLRAFARSRARLLFWSGLCFAVLTLHNVALVLDRFVFLEVDFAMERQVIAVIALALLLYGLIWEES